MSFPAQKTAIQARFAVVEGFFDGPIAEALRGVTIAAPGREFDSARWVRRYEGGMTVTYSRQTPLRGAGRVEVTVLLPNILNRNPRVDVSVTSFHAADPATLEAHVQVMSEALCLVRVLTAHSDRFPNLTGLA